MLKYQYRQLSIIKCELYALSAPTFALRAKTIIIPLEEIPMLIFNDLKLFFRAVMRYVGNGYSKCQISTIPEKKKHKIAQIDTKMNHRYLSDLSQGKRQYRRKQGLANYAVLRYRDMYLVLKSPGKDETGEKWHSIYRTPLILGKILKLEIYKDERRKNTVKIEKELLKDIKASIMLSIEKRAGAKFHAEMGKLYNLSRTIPYRGLNMQISTLLKEVKEAQKKHGTHFTVPKFF